ncbi:MAG: hypothetical protein R3362_13550, partial [Rhodothermales bacterium]|nr:hypothetical protein [Rhodothermales bacterium]
MAELLHGGPAGLPSEEVPRVQDEGVEVPDVLSGHVPRPRPLRPPRQRQEGIAGAERVVVGAVRPRPAQLPQPLSR